MGISQRGEVVGSNGVLLNKVPTSIVTDPRMLTITADGNVVLVDAFNRVRGTALTAAPGANAGPFVLEISDA
ncbi:hypothetical protein HKX48_000910, partial [Thoreauomyces humboldtii]